MFQIATGKCKVKPSITSALWFSGKVPAWSVQTWLTREKKTRSTITLPAWLSSSRSCFSSSWQETYHENSRSFRFLPKFNSKSLSVTSNQTPKTEVKAMLFYVLWRFDCPSCRQRWQCAVKSILLWTVTCIFGNADSSYFTAMPSELWDWIKPMGETKRKWKNLFPGFLTGIWKGWEVGTRCYHGNGVQNYYQLQIEPKGLSREQTRWSESCP